MNRITEDMPLIRYKGLLGVARQLLNPCIFWNEDVRYGHTVLIDGLVIGLEAAATGCSNNCCSNLATNSAMSV